MPKATQVKKESADFSTPPCFRGGHCAFCGNNVPDYHGYHIGDKVYCSFDEYVKSRGLEND